MSRSPRPALTARPRLLVIGPHRLSADALRSALRMKGFDVADPDSDESDPFEAVGEQRPDMIILDIDTPDESWNSKVLPVLEAFPSVKVLAVTERTDSLASRDAGDAGLQGCMAKDAALSAVVASIKAVMKGQRVFSQRERRAARAVTDEERFRALLAMQITPRERDVLALLSKGAPMDEIARRLSITRNTVRTYLNSVFTKLQVHTRHQAVAAAVRYGVVKAPGWRRLTTGS